MIPFFANPDTGKFVLNSYTAYIAGMTTRQYTIRGVPTSVDRTVREQVRKTGQSMNTVVLDALRRGLGLTQDQPQFHDLDDLAGTWVSDPEFDRAMEMFESIDEELWK